MRRAMHLMVLVGAVLLAPLAAQADEAVPTLADPVVERRAVELESQLRCLVCQNQTIAESNAGLASDLRKQVREQITAGKTNEEIIDYMTARYGDFVLYRPPFKATTALLWAGPALLLLAGGLIGVRLVRARRRAVGDLSAQEHERALQLLAGAGEEAKKP